IDVVTRGASSPDTAPAPVPASAAGLHEATIRRSPPEATIAGARGVLVFMEGRLPRAVVWTASMTPRPSTFVDHALSARLEAAEAAQLEGFARIVAERLPDLGAAVAEIAGGRASFLLPHVSVSRAVGLGMSGPVTAADVDALEAFYRTRGTEARILVSP